MTAFTVASGGSLHVGFGTIYGDGVVAYSSASIINDGSIGGAGIAAGYDVGITNNGAISSAGVAVQNTADNVRLTNNSNGVIVGGGGTVGAAGTVTYNIYGHDFYAGRGAQGGLAAAGVVMNNSTYTGSGSFRNYGAIRAGKGGAGGAGANEPTGYSAGTYSIGGGLGGYGGDGGYGVGVGGMFGSNGGQITGGAGGDGGQGGLGNGQSGDALGGNGGSGGHGGYGLVGGGERFVNQPVYAVASAYQSAHGAGTIIGGAGGRGADGTSETNSGYAGNGGQGGNGGYGGFGVRFVGGGYFQNYGAVIGGAGGAAGNGGHGTFDGAGGFAGHGGAGGYGFLGYLTEIVNGPGGYIRGGNGGAGGAYYGSASFATGGNGGRGGGGIGMIGSLLINYGDITGGKGGAGGAGPTPGYSGTNGFGVVLGEGGTIINKGGTISGTFGVAEIPFASFGITVANYGGLISGTDASVIFARSSDLLIVGDKAKFVGDMYGHGATISFAANSGVITNLGSGYGTISGRASGYFSDFGTYETAAGTRWTLKGGVTLSSGHTLVDRGTVTLAGAVGNSGQIMIYGGLTNADLRITSPGLTLTGGGTVLFADAKSRIFGVPATAALANVDNTIIGAGQLGLGRLALTNEASGLIEASGGTLVLNTGTSTVINGGVIESTSAAGTYGSGLLLVRGATIDNTGGTIADFGRIQLDGATIDGGALTIGAGGFLLNGPHASTINLSGGTVSSAGTVSIGAGGLTIDGDVANAALLQSTNSTLDITGSVTGGGRLRLVGDATLEVDGDITGDVYFAGTIGSLKLGGGLTGTVHGFSHTGGSTIDLINLAFDTSYTTSYSGGATGGTLTIKDGSNNVLATINFAGNYLSSTFVLSGDAGGTGTTITDPPSVSKLSSAMASFSPAAASTGSTAAQSGHQAPVLATPGG